MQHFHDPIRQSKYLRQTLSQDKKPIGFFISAGCPLAVNMPNGKDWPLIPDVAGLTSYIKEELTKPKEKEGKEGLAKLYSLLESELKKADIEKPNIEDILSFIRGMIQISKGADNIRGFSESDLDMLEKEICRKIAQKLNVELPNKNTPYHKLSKWVNNIERDRPIEIFTTNYDLLLEQALEDVKVPFFDGFVGAKYPFFDLRAVEDGLTPAHWTRLWKIHGSINWFLKDGTEVYRSNQLESNDSYIIHPSHLKYDQSRKMPYLALIDRLNRFLRESSAVLILSGYSFSDDHLNDTIINALRSNPTAMVIALLYGPLTVIEKRGNSEIAVCKYEKALKLAENVSNLSIWNFDEAVIGGLRGKWLPSKMDFDREENLGNAVQSKRINIADKESSLEYEFKLGDFDILGDFLQELVGREQFKIEENV